MSNKIPRKASWSRRLLTSFAATGIACAMAGSPAQAASSMQARLNITAAGGDVLLNVNVLVPTSQWDAQGYINNGAEISIDCFGDDPVFDEALWIPNRGWTALFGKNHSNPLFATQEGVRANLSVRSTGIPSWLNEDAGDKDEVYCKAEWEDVDGGHLKVNTNIVSGWF